MDRTPMMPSGSTGWQSLGFGIVGGIAVGWMAGVFRRLGQSLGGRQPLP